MARICVVTAGQLSTSPRMVKVADALSDSGHEVTVVSTIGWVAWAETTDSGVALRRAGRWKWEPLRWDRHKAFATWLWSGCRFRIMRWTARVAPKLVGSLLGLGNAHVRISGELASHAERKRCDLYYGGGSALAATALAARTQGAPFALDLEDFHSEEVDPDVDHGLSGKIVEHLERQVLPEASFLTTSSEEIAEAYRAKYGVVAKVIHNVFTVSGRPQFIRRGASDPFRMYWFSQTIGRQRGLEDAVEGAGLLNVPIELHLRGNAQPDYIKALSELARRAAPNLSITYHPPSSPDKMVSLAQGYHVGLALEQPHVRNRDLCLTNKAFIYMLAGLAIVLTRTTAQARFAAEMKAATVTYPPGSARGFAASLKAWIENPNLLYDAQRASWRAGSTRWHWDHPEERGAMLELVTSALQ